MTALLNMVRLKLRAMRAHYINNVNEGRCEMDEEVLADYDATLRKLDNGTKGLRGKH